MAVVRMTRERPLGLESLRCRVESSFESDPPEDGPGGLEADGPAPARSKSAAMTRPNLVAFRMSKLALFEATDVPFSFELKGLRNCRFQCGLGGLRL